MSLPKTRDVLGFGCTAIDELLYVDEWPERDYKTPVRRLETQGGGLGATALVAAARLGARCSYAGMLGFDEPSQRMTQILEDENIDLSLVSWQEGASPVRSFIVVDTSHQSRNIFFSRPSLIGAPLASPSESEIAASRCLFIDHYGGTGNVRLCELAKRHQVPIVADFERTNVPEWETFFPLVDHLILSRSFATRLTNETEPSRIVRALWNEHRKVVTITRGEQGAFASEDGHTLIHSPAIPVEVVDTTGCGDCFHGVYCAALAWDFPLEKRLHWANVAASLKARTAGAQKGLPTRAEVETALRLSPRF